MNRATYRLLQIQKENIHTNVPATRKKIKEGMISLMHLILTIPAEELTKQEIDIAMLLSKSKTVQRAWEKMWKE